MRTKKPNEYIRFKEHETGFEPATLALARRYSTTEPLVHLSVDENHYNLGKIICQAKNKKRSKIK